MIDLKGKPVAIFVDLFTVSRLGDENSSHVDQIIRDYPKSDPSAHAIIPAIATPIPLQMNE